MGRKSTQISLRRLLGSHACPFFLVQLVDEAFQRWLVEEEGVVDDITAVVVKFTSV